MVAAAVTPEYAAQQNAEGRLSDEALVRSTGYTWNEWFAIVDAQGRDRSRAEIAEFLKEAHGLSLWWANTINVGYERARAARADRRPRDGYQIGVSKTFPATVDRVFSAFVDPSSRERWLGGADLRLVASQPDRSARFDWEDGASRVSAHFTVKGEKTRVRVQHSKLSTGEEADAMKLYWRDRLTELQSVLSSEAGTAR